MIRLLLYLGLALGGAAGALQCNRQAIAPSEELAPPDRRTVQRANLRSDTWQLIVCSADTCLLRWARETVGQRPRDKTLVLKLCEDYDPTLPAIVVGAKLPPAVGQALQPTLDELGYAEGQRLVLNTLRSP